MIAIKKLKIPAINQLLKRLKNRQKIKKSTNAETPPTKKYLTKELLLYIKSIFFSIFYDLY